MDRTAAALVNERILGLDSVDIGNIDYSYKTVKPILHDEAKVMEIAQAQNVIPSSTAVCRIWADTQSLMVR